MKPLTRYFLLIIFMGITQQCGVYSFTGAALSPEVETISIQNFYNESGGGPPNLSQTFTEKIKDYYLRNTSLAFKNLNGDLQLEGSITGYDLTPVSPQASNNENQPDEAGLMRLTITVNATYINTHDDEFNFENRSFSFYDDFNPRQTTLRAAEDRLIETIFDNIVLDIFNASVANW